MTYAGRQLQRINASGSRLCVGLDPRAEQTSGGVEDFLRRVIDETAPSAAAFKPNMAYFEAMGSSGIAILERILAAVPDDIPVILDAKRSDIGETQRYYAKAYFENWDVDAVTLNPFLGYDSLEPFLAYPDKGIYLLAVTSNGGSNDLQLKPCGDRHVFELVQDLALRAPAGSAGLVIGLTTARDWILERIADLPLLIPGLGAQGGDLTALARQRRQAPIVINVSRGILYASDDRSFSQRARDYVEKIAAAFPP